MRAQSSFEYLMIFGIALGILLPSIYVFYGTAVYTQDILLYSQVNGIGQNIIATSRSIYYSGEYSRDSILINFPAEILSIKIYDNHELVIYFATDRGDDSLVLWSDVSLITPIDEGGGVYRLTPDVFTFGQANVKVVSQGDTVLVYLEGYS